MLGSIRIPASWSGLFGLKPTYGRTTLGPDFGEYWGQSSHEHVLTTTVRDSAAVLDAVHGPGPGDPSSAPPPAGPYVADMEEDPGVLHIALRVQMPFGAGEPDPDAVEAVHAGADLLGGLGHTIVEAAPGPLDETDDPPDLNSVAFVHAASELDRVGDLLDRELTADDVEPWTWMVAEGGRSISASKYVAITRRLHRFRREMAMWIAINDYALLLTPTAGCGPPPVGQCAGDQPVEDVLPTVVKAPAFTGVFNVCGWPAVSIPAPRPGDATPMGFQIAAAYGREDLLFQVAAQVERAAPWPRNASLPHGPLARPSNLGA